MAVDNIPVTIDISDDPRLRYANVIVKRRALLQWWGIQSDKEIRFSLIIRFYANNGGQYGLDAISAINADDALTKDQKAWQRITFQDRHFEYNTRGKWVDVNGNSVDEGTVGAITELEYWQQFKLNQVQGIVNMDHGAFASVYLIATAMIKRLDVMKVLG